MVELVVETWKETRNKRVGSANENMKAGRYLEDELARKLGARILIDKILQRF